MKVQLKWINIFVCYSCFSILCCLFQKQSETIREKFHIFGFELNEGRIYDKFTNFRLQNWIRSDFGRSNWLNLATFFLCGLSCLHFCLPMGICSWFVEAYDQANSLRSHLVMESFSSFFRENTAWCSQTVNHTVWSRTKFCLQTSMPQKPSGIYLSWKLFS